MNEALLNLIAANAAFVGTHFAMSHPLRGPMVKAFGAMGFQVVYSLISIATLAWVYFAFKAMPPADLPGTGDVGWAIATVLTLPAMVLFAGSMGTNPAMPVPGAEAAARAAPTGAFKVTRHPMMWGFALWALSHIVIHYSVRTTVTALAMGILALVGAKLQDRKKQALMGDAWIEWERNTSFWPRWGAIFGAGAVPWIIGLVFFFGFSWLHLPLGDVAAGIWRWF